MSHNVITRFAPSPTGHLHLGGARTALFNWLYAKHNNGKFLLRIEDTDKKRSSKELIDSIINAMSWLKIPYDGEIVLQSKNISRHIEIANQLILNNKAYYCYCSEEEINKEKEEFSKKGLYYKHNCIWKNKNFTIDNLTRVIRLRSPTEGVTSFDDKVYGNITVSNTQLDDMVLLRSDNTPTYLLSVVVDDHDMNITHIIRGTDHLTNTARQLLIYNALEWNPPKFAHIPLIHDEDGNKLSKRHQAIGIHEYKNLGILPEAISNYLLRMGWSHEDDEIISMDQAIKWFSIKNIGQSPARLDNKKLEFLNNHYISLTEDEVILNMIIPIIEKKIGYMLNEVKKGYLLKGLYELKKRTKNLVNLANESLFYVEDVPISIDQEASAIIKDYKHVFSILYNNLSRISEKEWNNSILTSTIKNISQNLDIKISNIYHCLRASIVGRMNAPSIIEIMINLQQEECLKRIKYAQNIE
ncbi:glutamate--tRNA ligase [Ehrlichia chaffeensis str. Heartland]|uniref:Glutamate--tRNA ligase 2 n=1 Tax=Ehrlichia chaffeensis (strain ATCC CRL-10679 / Arkansas) TaxID=205920 RepID=SYE2_EHRCR|nr:glutamate--tRNA ligase [Ehrlichia chaffeensis]Q2GGL8.1 RecName: Full=Glutamate--tRNA ligase 2; AltName: Full=Glutamyl-tRNA synthetase 2; Short=GluRS 2 [Ehrlichia chaffeensis str. Arkansas]ABD45013.1 glutamyl-tRNA synthetase [Ehrlichia chaffeensis str. Arkansas]AHX03686.1 glutamate--tRNA ligase [Ehrlichia chaffeensis str. Heartland]AHX05593.1 glutamate--tRNA ligase [Ehrlichia chaffeensis str. Jax]AHX06583.1 glutamate--tRNA ligase [Ehrlichia chaffeensis str. Liberty]AHX07978.1 glutamate--tRN